MKQTLLLLVSVFASLSADAGIVEKPAVYEPGGVKLEGFHAHDEAIEGKRPGILIIHQWTGLTDYEKMRARTLAELGYNVFAADVYGTGYCFGVAGVLELARSGTPIAGVVSFHGGLAPAQGMEAKPGGVTAKVLVLHGAMDASVPPAEVEVFGKEMAAAGADWRLVMYGGAVHAFTQKMAWDDISKGAAYDAIACERLWRDMRDFFAEIFGEP